MAVLGVLLAIIAAFVCVPVALFFLECLLGAGWRETRPTVPRRPGARALVLIPAHNEEAGIATTLTALKAELSAADSILVIADNCTDGTAAVARELGAQVAERHHDTERGKGFALAFGAERIAALPDPPDVVVVMDADCRFRPGGFEHLVAECLASGRPMQADYELSCPAGASSTTKISVFSFRVKNTLRTRGMLRMGIPRHLTGTGMAFPFALYRDAPNTRGWITEDLVLGLELAIRGTPVQLCSRAMVESDMAPSEKGRSGQRQRWEHGHLSALKQYVPQLLWAGISKGRPSLLGLALDLGVPPLALLAFLVAGFTSVSALAALLGAGTPPLIIMAAGSLAFAVAVAVAWVAHGRDILSMGDLARIPLYMGAKIASYLKWFGGRGSTTWERAERRKNEPK